MFPRRRIDRFFTGGNMFSKNLLGSLLLVISATSMAQEYITPGPGSGGGQKPPPQDSPNPNPYCPPQGCFNGNNPPPGTPGNGGGHVGPAPGQPDYRPGPGRPDYGGGQGDHGRPDYGGGQGDHGRPDYGRPDHGGHGPRPGHGPEPGQPGYGGGHYNPPPQYYPPQNPPYYPQPPQYNPPPYYPPAPPYNPPPQYPDYPSNPDYGQREVKTMFIGRSVQNERFPLRKLADIGSRYNGWEVVSVRANTRPNSSARTTVLLNSDGRIVASQVNPGYQVILIPNTRLILGSNLAGLEFTIQGSTIVDEVYIELAYNGGGYPNPPDYNNDRIELYVNRYVSDSNTIDLSSQIDFYRYNGMKIVSAEIQGRSDYNSASVTLAVGQYSYGTAQFSNYSQTQYLQLSPQPVIGSGSNSIVLYTRGSLTVERVVLNLSRY